MAGMVSQKKLTMKMKGEDTFLLHYIQSQFQNVGQPKPGRVYLLMKVDICLLHPTAYWFVTALSSAILYFPYFCLCLYKEKMEMPSSGRNVEIFLPDPSHASVGAQAGGGGSTVVCLF